MWLMYIVSDPVICYAILTTESTSGGAYVTHAYPEITSLVYFYVLYFICLLCGTLSRQYDTLRTQVSLVIVKGPL
jgi:hypothetical protein